MFGGRGESAVRERGVPANQTSLSSHVTSLGTPAQTPSSKHSQLQNRGAKFKRKIKMNVRQLENMHPLDGQFSLRLRAKKILRDDVCIGI